MIERVRDLLPPILTGSFDCRYDKRSFGEPLKALRSIPIVDDQEPMVDLRNYCTSASYRTGCIPYVRETVAKLMRQAQLNLPENWNLIINTGYRTRQMQQDIRNNILDMLRKDHPEWTPATIIRMLNRMVAPLDPRAPAPHTTGAAIDVHVKDQDGKAIRFSNKEDWWSHAPTYSHDLEEESRTNRMILIEAFQSAGLTNYLGEWWHWSYGDQGWALRTGAKIAYYGETDIKHAEYLSVPDPETERLMWIGTWEI